MDWILSLLLATVRLAIPVLLISLAELYGQRAGMVNIGLEGLASIGALVGFLVCYVTGSNWLGLLCGALAGILVNMIYAFSTVTLCADHTVYGMAVNIFAPALASFIYRVYFGTGSDLKQITTMASIAIPGLKDIPVIGPLLFDQSPMVYLTFVLVIVTAVFFGKTRAGLSYKSVGEHPQAAATLGINVIGVKYLACVICGALAAAHTSRPATPAPTPTASSPGAASSRWPPSSSAAGTQAAFCLPACSSASVTRCRSVCRCPASPSPISSSR